ncbi:MAG: DUF2061 domain-containing protein [Candidatus Nanoarchaeia archaeon]
MSKDHPKRSVLKSITWRACATVTTILLVWGFVGEIAIALSVGLLEIVIKMIVYYVHERAWNNTAWGSCEDE